MKLLSKLKVNYYFYEILFITIVLGALMLSYIVLSPKIYYVDCENISVEYCQKMATDIRVKVVMPKK